VLYRPNGVQIRVPFTVPELDGSNNTGLSWTVQLLTKNGTPLTSGTEYDSISVAEHSGDKFYELLFTPEKGSTAVYLITMISDNPDVADVFECLFEPDYSWLLLYAKMVRDLGASPETLEFLKPDGSRLVKYKVYREGLREIREEL
jgi:hypothetical protein